jgi:chromosome segregation ATPase
MTNNNIKILLDEVKEVIQELKTNTNLTGQAKTDLEKRISHILDKSNPRHSNLTEDLKTDLKELVEIEKSIGQERIAQTKKQKELEDKNKSLESDNQNKDKEIKEKEEQIGKKITTDLVSSLEKLTKDGNLKLDESKLTELKTILNEVKEKKTDLTSTDNKLEEVKKKVQEIKPSTNH